MVKKTKTSSYKNSPYYEEATQLLEWDDEEVIDYHAQKLNPEALKKLIESESIDQERLDSWAFNLLVHRAELFETEQATFDKTLDVLFAAGANIDGFNYESTLTEIIKKHNNLRYITYLLQKGLSISYLHRSLHLQDDLLPFHQAAITKRVDIMRTLIAQGADVTEVDQWRNTPLILSVARYPSKKEQLLNNPGGKVRYNFKGTPNEYTLIELLLDHGANPLTKNSEGQSAFSIVDEKVDENMVDENMDERAIELSRYLTGYFRLTPPRNTLKAAKQRLKISKDNPSEEHIQEVLSSKILIRDAAILFLHKLETGKLQLDSWLTHEKIVNEAACLLDNKNYLHHSAEDDLLEDIKDSLHKRLERLKRM